VCDRAAHRAPIPDLGVADVARRFHEQRHSLSNCSGALQIRLPDQRAHPQRIAVDLGCIETRNAVDIDEDRRPNKPQIEQRHETLTPGEHFAVTPVPAEDLDSALEI
jgi:hypothetical protein